MNNADFNNTETGKAFQAVLDVFSGLDGGASFLDLKQSLMHAEESGDSEVTEPIRAFARQLCNLMLPKKKP